MRVADPEVGPPVRIEPLDDRARIGALAESRHAKAANFGQGKIGDVDVDQQRIVPAEALDVTHERAHNRARRFPVEGLPCLAWALEREGERGDSEDPRLHRGRDRAGVGDVIAEIAAVIDAGEDELRSTLEAARHSSHRQEHAIGRSSVDREARVVELPQAKRATHGQRMARAALLSIRRHDLHLAEVAHRGVQREQAFGLDPIVIGQQDSHCPSFSRDLGTSTRRERKSPLAARSSVGARVERLKCEIWSGRLDSNQRPLAPHASALPGCATPRPIFRARSLEMAPRFINWYFELRRMLRAPRVRFAIEPHQPIAQRNDLFPDSAQRLSMLRR